MSYIIYDGMGKILRVVDCSPALSKVQAKKGELIMEGTANDATQKIVDGKVINKTPQELEADNPSMPEIPESQRPAFITNEQWQDVLDRLDKLEIR